MSDEQGYALAGAEAGVTAPRRDNVKARLEARLAQLQPTDPLHPLLNLVVETSMRDVAWTIGYLQRLLNHPALAQQPAARSRVWYRLALAFMNEVRWDDAEHALHHALELAQDSDSPERQLMLRGAQVRLRILRFDIVGATALAPQVFDDALAGGDASSLVFLLESMAILGAVTGRHARADALARQALLTLRTCPKAMHASVEASALHNRCIVLMQAVLDAYNHGQDQLLAARLAALRQPLAEAAAAASGTRSTLLMAAGQPLRALWEVLQLGHAAQLPAGRAGWPTTLNAGYGHLAQALEARNAGDAALALWHAEQALSRSHADRYEFGVKLAAQRELSRLRAAAGQWVLAWEAAQQAQALARQRDDEQAAYAIADALAHMRGEHDLATTMIGHHLRTSVATVRALAAGAAEAGLHERLDTVARLADQALGHADAFLRNAELQQLGPQLATDIYVPGLVAEAVDEARHAVDPMPAPAEECVEPDLRLRSHARTLHRLLVGLLLEAHQAAAAAGLAPRVQVSARRGSDGVVLSVHRQGPPLSAAGLRGVFDESLLLQEGQALGDLALRYAGRAARALGGVAAAVNHADGSATVALSLPDLAAVPG